MVDDPCRQEEVDFLRSKDGRMLTVGPQTLPRASFAGQSVGKTLCEQRICSAFAVKGSKSAVQRGGMERVAGGAFQPGETPRCSSPGASS